MKSLAARPEQVEEAILDAFDRMLARDGYRQLQMDDLAREAGVAKGVIYLHYPTKSDVLLAHVDRIAVRVIAELQRVATSPASPAEKLRQMILLRVMQRFDSVQHYPETIGDVIRELGPELLHQREKHFAAEARIFAGVLKDAQGAIAIRADEHNAFANAVIAATNALLPYNLSAAEFGKRREVVEKTERIATMLLGGLLRPQRASKRAA